MYGCSHEKYLSTINILNTATTERSEKAQNIDIHYTLVLPRHTAVQYGHQAINWKIRN